MLMPPDRSPHPPDEISGASPAAAADEATSDGAVSAVSLTPPPPAPPTPASDTEVATPKRRRRFWPIVLTVVVVAFVIGAATVPLPYYLYRPGSVRDTEPLIAVDGAEVYASDGTISYTTVSLRQATLFGLASGWIDDDVDVVPRDEVLGGLDADENRTLNMQMMDTSKQVATQVALERLGHPVDVSITGETVVEVIPDMPADGVLEPGDTITAVDGEPLDDPDDLTRLLGDEAPGDEVTVTVQSSESAAERDVELALAADPDDPERAIMGVRPSPRPPNPLRRSPPGGAMPTPCPPWATPTQPADAPPGGRMRQPGARRAVTKSTVGARGIRVIPSGTMSPEPPLDATGIARRHFSPARKGYDPAEVRGYLHELSDLVGRLQRAEARQLDRAEHDGALRKVQILAEADAIRRDAESALERGRAEGQALVDEMRRQAESERERMLADGEQARAVGEAEAVRERMLGDLARRRRSAREQLERLNAARERLLAAYEVVRRTVDEATTELTVALPEAKAASELALRRVTDEPEPTADELEAELAVARMSGLVDDDAGERDEADVARLDALINGRLEAEELNHGDLSEGRAVGPADRPSSGGAPGGRGTATGTGTGGRGTATGTGTGDRWRRFRRRLSEGQGDDAREADQPSAPVGETAGPAAGPT